jgi:hypothetical protein
MTAIPAGETEPAILVREAEPAAPSYAYARSVIPQTDGESEMVVEVTREQVRADAPVRVTLVMAADASTADGKKESLR